MYMPPYFQHRCRSNDPSAARFLKILSVTLISSLTLSLCLSLLLASLVALTLFCFVGANVADFLLINHQSKLFPVFISCMHFYIVVVLWHTLNLMVDNADGICQAVWTLIQY